MAGLSAALMLGRARRKVLVVDAGQPRNRFAAHMHGVLGQEGVDPAELVARGRAEAAEYGVEFRDGLVERLVDEGDHLGLHVNGGTVAARAVVMATGLIDELPEIPGLAERWGRTVLHCPYCHGWEVRDQRLVVIATSPFAVHQAELVRQWSRHVTLITHALESLEPVTEQRLRSRDVEVVTARVHEVVGAAPYITGVRTDDGHLVEADAVFTFGTPRPHDGLLADLTLEYSDGPWGRFLTVDSFGRTSHDRIWAVGNVVNPAANVPMAIGAGAFTGGAVNLALVAEEFDLAEASGRQEQPTLNRTR